MGDLILLMVLTAASFGLGVSVAYDYDPNGKLIEACQADLPRSQKCVVVAVPEREVKK